MAARRSSEKVKTAPSISGDTSADFLSKKKKSVSHQACESDGKGGLKSKETPCLPNRTVTPPVQQFSIPHPSGPRRI
jgi:hypothetical protein